MRINKYLAQAGLGSRRKVEELVTGGKIKVNGKIEKNLSADIKETDIVYYENRAVKPTASFVYYKWFVPFLTTAVVKRLWIYFVVFTLVFIRLVA